MFPIQKLLLFFVVFLVNIYYLQRDLRNQNKYTAFLNFIIISNSIQLLFLLRDSFYQKLELSYCSCHETLLVKNGFILKVVARERSDLLTILPVVTKANSTRASSLSAAAKWNTLKMFFQPDLTTTKKCWCKRNI